LLTKPVHWIALALAVIIINVVSVNLINNSLYYPLETSIYDKHNEYLSDAKSDVIEQFSSTDKTQWQDLVFSLENKYNASGSILPRQEGYIDPAVLDKLNQAQGQKGYIDLLMAVIYYPLDDENVLELGPIPYEHYMVWIADWLPWLSTSIINGIILFVVLHFQRRQQLMAMKELHQLPITFHTPKSLEVSLRQTHNYLLEIQEQNNQRLLLQQDLLHGVAHEFRSPMARIQFALDMLDDAESQEQPQLQQSIHSALNDLDELVKELLYYAKLKDDSAALVLTHMKVNELINHAISKVANFYPDVQFQTDIEQGLSVHADSNLITRMLINLLRNAGRFAKSKCQVSVKQTETHTEILIEDDGIGIPPGKHERIFEPFTRLDPSRSRDSGGCGLGLAIVASIITKHHASISVLPLDDERRSLSGAAFFVQIPR